MAMTSIDMFPVGCIVYDVDYMYTAEVACNDSDHGVLLLRDKAHGYLFPIPRWAAVRVDSNDHQCKHTYHDVQHTDISQRPDYAELASRADASLWAHTVMFHEAFNNNSVKAKTFMWCCDRLEKAVALHYLD